MTVYGIKNCDTVKSAIAWLKRNEVGFEFHDYKTKGIEERKLKDWCKQVGWESLLNKRGTTWRKLTQSEQAEVDNEKAAILLMLSKTSIIKRPLIEKNERIIALGFDENSYSKLF